MEPEVRLFYAISVYALGALITGLAVTKIAPTLKKKEIRDYSGENFFFCIFCSFAWPFFLIFLSIFYFLDFIESHLNWKHIVGYEIFPSKKKSAEIPFGRASDHSRSVSPVVLLNSDTVDLGPPEVEYSPPLESPMLGPSSWPTIGNKQEICCIGIVDGEIVEED